MEHAPHRRMRQLLITVLDAHNKSPAQEAFCSVLAVSTTLRDFLRKCVAEQVDDDPLALRQTLLRLESMQCGYNRFVRL